MNRALRRKQGKMKKKEAQNLLFSGSIPEKLKQGVIFHKQKAYTKALVYYQSVLKKDPNNIDALYLKGATLVEVGRFDDAIGLLCHCLTLKEDSAPAHHNLGLAYHEKGDFSQACAHLKRALALEPSNNTTAFFLERAQAEDNNKSGGAYIQKLYDVGASLFEENLVQNLGYDGPKKLMQCLLPYLEETCASGVDLGCGTGLMGAALSGRVAHFVGVDLSEKMLKEAEKKGVYQACEVGDLETFLEGGDTLFDLITAADVLIYVGPLERTFKGVRARLKSGGLFAFTAETLLDDHPDELWLDMDNNRHKHKKSYLQRLAIAYGFEVLCLEEDFLRYENKKPVMASYVVLRRE